MEADGRPRHSLADKGLIDRLEIDVGMVEPITYGRGYIVVFPDAISPGSRCQVLFGERVSGRVHDHSLAGDVPIHSPWIVSLCLELAGRPNQHVDLGTQTANGVVNHRHRVGVSELGVELDENVVVAVCPCVATGPAAEQDDAHGPHALSDGADNLVEDRVAGCAALDHAGKLRSARAAA